MGPLVYYARWQGVKLRLQGRDGPVVWGVFVKGGEDEMSEDFRFDNRTFELTLGKGEAQQRIILDEMGVTISREGDESVTTNSGAEP